MTILTTIFAKGYSMTPKENRDVIKIRKTVVREKEAFKKLDNIKEQFLLRYKTCVFGDWKEPVQLGKLEAIRDAIRLNHNCFATTLKDIMDAGNISDFAAEQKVINDYQILLCIEGEGSGTISENTQMMQSRKFQSKAILILDHGKHYEAISEKKKFYLHFPRKYFCNMKDVDDLVRVSSEVASSEAHRLAENDLLDYINNQKNPSA